MPLPSAAFDRIQVDVTKWLGASGGLAEIQLMSGGKNLALNAEARASGTWDHRFPANSITDGETSSREMGEGYWLPPDGKPGWIEIVLPEEVTAVADGPTPATDDFDYLGDLAPTQVDVLRTPEWAYAPKGTMGANGNRKISVNGTESPNGIGVVPATNGLGRVGYRLARRYRRFTAGVAINDTSVRSQTPVTFAVIADSKEVWRSKPVQVFKQRQDFDLDLSGVDRLELVVWCTPPITGAHAVWIEPLLQRSTGPVAATLPREGPATQAARIPARTGPNQPRLSASSRPWRRPRPPNPSKAWTSLPLRSIPRQSSGPSLKRRTSLSRGCSRRSRGCMSVRRLTANS